MSGKMDLILTRKHYLPEGIFSELTDESGKLVAQALEHSYSCIPKLPPGEFVCRRGMHQLAHMSKPFQTFEITEVPGHSDILFHTGNFNSDSEGCVLLGKRIYADSGPPMLVDSVLAFVAFMEMQRAVDTFKLTVNS